MDLWYDEQMPKQQIITVLVYMIIAGVFIGVGAYFLTRKVGTALMFGSAVFVFGMGLFQIIRGR